MAANGPAGVDFALDYAKQNGWSSWYGAAKVGVGKWDGIGAKSAADADAVEKLGKSATDATGGLTTLGGGLSKLGQSMSTGFFPSAPSGGGLLSGLFGAFKPLGAQATLAASGAITGLFADGTESAPGGMAIVGERGPELVNLPRGSQVVPTHRMATEMNRGGGGGGNTHVSVGVSVDDEGNLKAYVKSVASQHAQQESSAAVASYYENQRRGSFGALQNRFASQKG